MQEATMFKHTILALSVVALTWPAIAQAQESAALTLRSGERINGELMDMSGVGFTVKVNGAERHIATNDVAVIDFGGGSMSDADWAKIPGGRPTVILRSGEVVNGRLVDIGGSSPLRMTIRGRSGDRDLASNEISHIILARPSNAPASTSTSGDSSSNANLAPATGNGIVVSARQAWTATGMTVKRNDSFSINANGEIQLSGDANDIATPFGSKSGRKAPNAPLPSALAGALIGRIGASGQPFAIGSGVTIKMPADGQLFLGVNDDGFDDNRGEFRVDLGRTNQRR
jgi:hypothetical protein